tara:strand:- start:8438 stop:9229 length:792 start_codon:yes stop_codon:yes gene_type:complete
MKLAILIPAFNDTVGLKNALQSISVEAGDETEVVVVDDGSAVPLTNDTPIENARVTILRLETNQGIVAALNAGLNYILKTDAELIARLDAGDVAVPDRFRLQLEEFRRRPNLSLLGGAVKFRNPNGTEFRVNKPIKRSEILDLLPLNSMFCHTAVMFRVDVVKRLGCYSYDYPAAEDYELFWRITKTCEVSNLSEVLVFVDNNPSGISLSKRRIQLKSRLKIQIDNFDGFRLNAYLGVFKTAFLFVVPSSILIQLKTLIKVVR